MLDQTVERSKVLSCAIFAESLDCPIWLALSENGSVGKVSAYPLFVVFHFGTHHIIQVPYEGPGRETFRMRKPVKWKMSNSRKVGELSLWRRLDRSVVRPNFFTLVE